MTPAEGETAILAVAALSGAAIAVIREAVRRNFVAFSVSLSVTKPDARWPKFPKAADTTPRPRPLPVGAASPGGASRFGADALDVLAAGSVPAASVPLSTSLRQAEIRRHEYAERRDLGMTPDDAARLLRLSERSRRRYEQRYRQDRAAAGNGAQAGSAS